VVGPNAIGKSNFLDAFRFLRDLVLEGGGLAKAVELHGGMKGVRSLFARAQPAVTIAATVLSPDGSKWRYELSFTHEIHNGQVPVVTGEGVTFTRPDSNEEVLLEPRPNAADHEDPKLLTQTAIQQVQANRAFRELAEFFRGVSYLHLVPQLLREGQGAPTDKLTVDQYGRELLDSIRNTPQRTREARLNRIGDILKVLAPQFEQLELQADEHGRPHLVAKFMHWRPHGAFQNEMQFSDGTLRLIGLMWALQEKTGPLLLEEPELSLHAAIVRKLAPFIHRAQKASNGRQVILSTHSHDLLMDEGIAPEETLLVEPGTEGSVIIEGASRTDITRLMQAGIPASEAILPHTLDQKQADLFDSLPV
jgi:predicted ATPase